MRTFVAVHDGSKIVPSRLISRNVPSPDGRTSMRLEPEMWDAITEIIARERYTLGELVERAERGVAEGGRTSAVRVFVLNYFRTAATEQGHRSAGHQPLPVRRVARRAGTVWR